MGTRTLAACFKCELKYEISFLKLCDSDSATVLPSYDYYQIHFVDCTVFVFCIHAVVMC